MTQPAKLNVSQQRRFYKTAVERTLVEFYSQPEEQARQTVESWWRRLTPTRAYKTLVFMHDEPMNTAAALVQKDVIAITTNVAPNYFRLLDLARAAVASPKLRPGKRDFAVKRPAARYAISDQGGGPEHLFPMHVARTETAVVRASVHTSKPQAFSVSQPEKELQRRPKTKKAAVKKAAKKKSSFKVAH